MWLALLMWLGFQDAAAFRTGVALVHVDAAATLNGRPLEGLTPADFRVTDDGEPRAILNFSPQEQPLDIILLLDVSASMEPVIARVAQTARSALAGLREGDRVALMVFSDQTRLRVDFTNDFGAVERDLPEILQMKLAYETRLQKGIDDAALLFLKEPSQGRRRAVLAVTDNLGNDYEDKAVEHLWQADAVLSGLIVAPSGAGLRLALARVGGMTAIAEKTGGETLNTAEAGEGLREAVRRLRQRYGFDYAMPAARPGELRQIRVELAGEAARRAPGAVVRARTGYVVPER
jgi:VWFA-related protein